jgi:glycosyltransferase involved in cell wall biosynthesis
MFGSESLNSYKSISPNITCYSWPSLEELRDLLDDSWLFVSPFVIAKSGDMDSPLCTTTKEALLMELQVLTTDICGDKEFKHVYYTTIDDITKGTGGLVYNQIIKERNIKGRQYVLDTFSPKVCIDRYLKAIEEVT